MVNPYTTVAVKNYNLNPPSDDGQKISTNEITWSKHKIKLGDPIKNAFEAIVDNANEAFKKLSGGLLFIDYNYLVSAEDYGRTLVVRADGITVTLPAPSTIGANFHLSIANMSTADITIARTSSETIDEQESLTIRPRGGIDLENDGTDWFTTGRNYIDRTLLLTKTVHAPEGYLTPVSQTPVIVSDSVSASTIYYTPDTGAQVPISDGLKFRMREFSQLSLALSSNHLPNAIYDVFLYENESRVVQIGTGPAWNNPAAGSGSRGTGVGTSELERWNGLLVNKGAITVRNGATTFAVDARSGVYLGSIYIDAVAGQVTCHRSWGQSRKWGIWNCFNRKRIVLKAGDPTSNWTYSSATIRQSNGQAGNRVTVFCGLAEEIIKAKFNQISRGGSDDDLTVGIGWNSTTAFTGYISRINAEDGAVGLSAARHENPPFLGIANVNSCEAATAGNINAIHGTERFMLLAVEWQG